MSEDVSAAAELHQKAQTGGLSLEKKQKNDEQKD